MAGKPTGADPSTAPTIMQPSPFRPSPFAPDAAPQPPRDPLRGPTGTVIGVPPPLAHSPAPVEPAPARAPSPPPTTAGPITDPRSPTAARSAVAPPTAAPSEDVDLAVSRGGATHLGPSFFQTGDDGTFPGTDAPDPEFDAEYGRRPSLLQRFRNRFRRHRAR